MYNKSKKGVNLMRNRIGSTPEITLTEKSIGKLT